jgi:DNA-binding winged helix-turn-helix (wHTH) protein
LLWEVVVRACFGDSVLDLDRRRLLRDGKHVHLSRKGFELLKLLLDRRPAVVSKKEIHEHIWPDTFVSDTNLANLVAEIRRALRDKARHSRIVRTVHGIGYAFEIAATVAAKDDREPKSSGFALFWNAQQIELWEGENLIGRDHSAAVWLDSSTISRRHARIVIQDADATLEDLGSKNGVYLQDVRVEAPTRLTDGDHIRLGTVLVTFRVLPLAASTATAPSPC